MHCGCDQERELTHQTHRAAPSIGAKGEIVSPPLLIHGFDAAEASGCSEIPVQDDPPSEWSDVEGPDEWELNAPSGTLDTYGERDNIHMFTLSRHEICRRWGDVRTASTSPARCCPIPVDLFDLGYATQVASTTQFSYRKSLELDGGRVIARCDGVDTLVRTTSDLFLNPWSCRTPRSWPYAIGMARSLFLEFLDLFEEGFITLDDGAGSTVRGRAVRISFDAPIPSLGRTMLDGRKSHPLDTSTIWRSEMKAIIGQPGPVWLEGYAFFPHWWPTSYYCGSRRTVPAFVDGPLGAVHDPMGCDAEDVVSLATTPRGIHIYGYISDVYDRTNAGVWVDYEAIDACHACAARGAYVVSTDGRSAYIDAQLVADLQQVDPGQMTIPDLQQSGKYPVFSMCRALGEATANPRLNTYAKLGRACFVGAPGIIRTIALSPFHLKLRPDGNCFFEIFRECLDEDGLSYGPVPAELVRQSWLLSRNPVFLRTALSLLALQVDEEHIRVCDDILNASTWTDLRGEFGLASEEEKPVGDAFLAAGVETKQMHTAFASPWII